MSVATTPAFDAAVAAYRAAAAAAFQARAALPKPPQPKPYARALFPALQAYLAAAVARHKAHSARVATGALPTHETTPAPRALGTGPPVTALGADVRRAAWLVWLSVRAQAARLPRGLSNHATRGAAHAGRALQSGVSRAPLPCGIPADVRDKFATLCMAQRAAAAAKAVPMVRLTAFRLGACDLEAAAPAWLAEHARRCAASLRAGESALRRRASGGDGDGLGAACDTFEAVRALYAGRPDTVYRRKSSRRFAAHRRRRREAVAAAARRAADAESGMRARRGHDHLLTDRVVGDTSFAPFLFELDSRAYAFSSKISEAPKLRGKMIDKYSAATCGESVDPLRKAHEAAETNPLFHTRVMNRFG